MYPSAHQNNPYNTFVYLGGRTEAEIVAWLKKKTGPPAKELPTVDSVKAFVDGNEVAVVGFFKDSASDEAKVFIEAASGIDDIPFGLAVGEESLKAYELEKFGSVVIFKKVINYVIWFIRRYYKPFKVYVYDFSGVLIKLLSSRGTTPPV